MPPVALVLWEPLHHRSEVFHAPPRYRILVPGLAPGPIQVGPTVGALQGEVVEVGEPGLFQLAPPATSLSPRSGAPGGFEEELRYVIEGDAVKSCVV